jgi:hypothetical protein
MPVLEGCSMKWKLQGVGRLAAAVAAGLALSVVAAPARAIDPKDLGIDLGTILGGAKGRGSMGLLESIIERELPRRVGPARRYDVRLGSEGTDLARGLLGSVDVTGVDVRTKDGLVIPDMSLHMEGVKVGLGSRSLESVARSAFSAALTPDVVTRFIRKRAGADVKDVRVQFRKGQLVVAGTPALMGFDLPSEVSGKPVLNGDDAVDFRASAVSVLGLRLPRFAIDELEKQINPVVDLSGLKLPVRITGLRVRGDRLVADGAAFFGRK